MIFLAGNPVLLPKVLYLWYMGLIRNMCAFFDFFKHLFSDKNGIEDSGALSGSTVESADTEDIQITENDNNNTVEITGPAENGHTVMKPIYNTVILLDNGHAKSTPGKRSPRDDSMPRFFEYEFNRDIVRRIAEKLDRIGIKYEILVPEVENDISLTSRAARANKMCNKYGKDNCLFLSIHANAAGDGNRWMTAKGWCCYTSKGETAADPCAELFMREAEKVLVPMGRTIRKYSQKKYSWEENFTVLTKTLCRAILTENLFYDNREEVKFLQSEEGRDAIAQIHVNAILKIENPD